jgi:hypothetical protein
LRPFVIDSIKNIINIEGCNNDGLIDLLAEQQFLERHTRDGSDVFRGCESRKPRDMRFNANYLCCLQGIGRKHEAIGFLAAWVHEAAIGHCTCREYDLRSAQGGQEKEEH